MASCYPALRVSLPAGTVIDRKYQLLAPIGAGGMGSVYRARHVLTEEVVALKVLDSHVGDDAQARRFKLEVSVAAKVKHPALVKVFDAGVELESGRLYLAMELLEGASLGSALSHRAIETAEAVALLADALDAIGAAHAEGVVHRDLKPDNLFVERAPDGSRRVRVLDFGIARDVSGPSVTTTGVAVGTALYMSPEQATASKAISAAADVWAMGAMLYELLVGQPPFNGPSAHAVVVEAVTQPHRPVAVRRPDLAEGWSDLVDQMLAKKSEDRPTVVEAASAIRTLLAEEAPADPPSRRASSAAAAEARKDATPFGETALRDEPGLDDSSAASAIETSAVFALVEAAESAAIAPVAVSTEAERSSASPSRPAAGAASGVVGLPTRSPWLAYGLGAAVVAAIALVGVWMSDRSEARVEPASPDETAVIDPTDDAVEEPRAPVVVVEPAPGPTPEVEEAARPAPVPPARVTSPRASRDRRAVAAPAPEPTPASPSPPPPPADDPVTTPTPVVSLPVSVPIVEEPETTPEPAPPPPRTGVLQGLSDFDRQAGQRR